MAFQDPGRVGWRRQFYMLESRHFVDSQVARALTERGDEHVTAGRRSQDAVDPTQVREP